MFEQIEYICSIYFAESEQVNVYLRKFDSYLIILFLFIVIAQGRW